MNLWTDAVVVDFTRNTIQLRVPGLGQAGTSTGLLDVGANGRLLGVELGNHYIQVMESVQADESYARTADVDLSVSEGDPAFVTIARRGAGYEITYPSGNECWQMTTTNGKLIQVCAVTAD